MNTLTLHNALTRVTRGCNTVLQLTFYSVLLSHVTFIPYVHATPTGGEIAGGSGSINQSGLTTTINQTSNNLAINWQGFDVNVNERVQFIQPNANSLALNRILSNNGTKILGRIDANGQVILVNPNGVFFSPTATLNVGGIIASGLDMSPDDFMNGHYIFNEVLGAEGKVINSGTINAAVGGNVTLLGKQVKNDGLISANLGTVNLAAGKQAVVTFDNNGLMGIKVTKEILQNELGVDPAVLNSGDITAAGGRVLMTGSVSQDIFSQAVNSGEAARSVVVNADGSFTLGGGADVVNSGSVDVSSIDSAAGQIVMLGENITSSGTIAANATNGHAGSIELHARNTTELTQNSVTRARAESSGTGGDIKLLGKNVGLFDNTVVDASGANGGGRVLIGGDRQGLNTRVRNAEFIYLGENTKVHADALDTGAGGKIITYANDTARIYGNLFARGGLNGGDGGFIETSGKQGFEILNAPDVSAVAGEGGLWLIDPYNITIQATGTPATYTAVTSGNPDVYTSSANDAVLGVDVIQTSLGNGSVSIITGGGGTQAGNITFDANLDFNTAGGNTRTLTLQAHNDINFTSASSITDSVRGGTSNAVLNLVLEANSDATGGGSILMASNATGINTFGGTFTVNRAIDFNSAAATINVGAGDINLDGVNGGVSGDVILGNLTASDLTSSDLFIRNANSINQQAGTAITINRDTFLGDAGTGTINLNQTANTFVRNITLQGADVTIAGTGDIIIDTSNVTNTLSVTSNNGTITDVGNITGNATATFSTTGNITLNDSNNFTSVNITNANNVTLYDTNSTGNTGLLFQANSGAGAGGITGTLDLRTVGGNITSAGEVNVGGTSTLRANGADRSIILNNAANTLAGVITLNTDTSPFNSINIANTAATSLNTVTVTNNLTASGSTVVLGRGGGTTSAGSLNVTASSTGGNVITQTGDLVVTGTTTLSAGGDILLNNTSNDFNRVDTTTARDLTLVDASSIVLGNTTATRDLSVSSGNADNANISQAIGTSLNIGRDANFATQDTGNNNIGNYVTLDNTTNVFTGAVSVTADRASITDSTALLLGQTSLVGGISETSTFTSLNGDITQRASTAILNDSSGAVTVFNAGTHNITLESYVAGNSTLTNDFTSVRVTNANNVSLVDGDNLGLGNMTIAGNLTVHGGRNEINASSTTQAIGNHLSSAVSVAGTTTLTARNGSGTNYTIRLDQGGNNFNNVVITDASGVTLVDGTGSINVGNTNVLSSLSVTANGTVTAGNSTINNNGALSVSGAANFAVANGQSINLNAANTFTTDPVFSSAGTLANITVNDSTNITIQDDLSITGNLNVTGSNITLQNTTVGSLNLNATQTDINGLTGDIMQSASSADSLIVNGLATMNAQSIILDHAANDFRGNVVVNNVNSLVTLVDAAGGIRLGDTGSGFISNNLNVTSAANITQANSIITGATVLNAGNDIILNNTANNFTGNVTVNTARDATVVDSNALTIGVAIVTRDLTLDAGGMLTLGAPGLSGAPGIVTVAGNLSVTGDGGIQQNGATATLAVTGNSRLTAVNGTTPQNITLNNVTNTFNTVEIVNANNVQLLDSAGAVGIQGNVAGTLLVTANGTVTGGGSVITNTGELNVGSTATFNVLDNQSIDLSNAANTFNVDPVFTSVGRLLNLNITDSSALTLQNNLIVQGNLTANASQLTFNNTTVSGALNATSGSGILNQMAGSRIAVTDTTTLTAGAGGIDLTQATNDFIGNVRVTTTSAGNAAIVDANTLILGATNVAGNLDAQANTINQTNTPATDNDGIVVAGQAAFAIGNGNSLTLNNPENRINAISVRGRTTGETPNNVVVNTASAIDLRDITLQGDLTVTATGNVSNTGVVNAAAGTTRITGAAIALNNAANDFNNVTLNGTTVSIVDANSLNFVGNTVATNGLSATALAGNITDASAASIIANNTSTLAATGNIVLDAANHDFDTLQLNSGGDVTIRDIDGLNLGTTSVLGALAVAAGTANTGTNNITNTGGAISVAGAASFITNNGSDVSLSNVGNQFTGAITADAASGSLNNVVIVNNTATLLQQVDAANLTITSSGDITDTDTAAIVVTNNTDLIANGNNVVLDASNDFNIVTANSVNNITLNDINILNLDNMNIPGTVTTTSNGLNLGSITAAAVNLDAGTGSIIDTNAGSVNLTAASVRLRAETGIGTATDALETRTGELDVINTVSGTVDIINTGVVTVTNLVNAGNVTFTNDETVTINNIRAVDSITTPTFGLFTMNVTNGAVHGIDRGDPNLNLTVPDITAYSAFVTVTDEFGTLERPIILYIRSGMILDSAFSSVGFPNPEWQADPFENSSAIQANAFDAIASVTGLKLVEVESVAEIDPAIFTLVRAYNYDDISIRMPSDQLYEDDEEEEKNR